MTIARHSCAGGTHRADEAIGPGEAQGCVRAGHVHADLQARARRDGGSPADPQKQ